MHEALQECLRELENARLNRPSRGLTLPTVMEFACSAVNLHQNPIEIRVQGLMHYSSSIFGGPASSFAEQETTWILRPGEAQSVLIKLGSDAGIGRCVFDFEGEPFRVQATATVGRMLDTSRSDTNVSAVIPAQIVMTGEVDFSIASVSTGQPYVISTAVAGAMPYIDRDYVIESLGFLLDGGALVRTANFDKAVSTDSHLVMSFGEDAYIYLVYDARGSIPAWS